MASFNKESHKNFLLISYKLLHDTLFVLLIFFALTQLAEGLLPRIIASHFGISKIIILVLINVFTITLLGNFLKIETAPQKINKKMIFFISFLGILLMLNSLLSVDVILNIVLTITAVGIAYVLYTILFRENNT